MLQIQTRLKEARSVAENELQMKNLRSERLKRMSEWDSSEQVAFPEL